MAPNFGKFTYADDQKHAIATTLSNGDFLVTQASNNQVENNSGYDLYAQRYDTNANKIGSAFLINEATDGIETWFD